MKKLTKRYKKWLLHRSQHGWKYNKSVAIPSLSAPRQLSFSSNFIESVQFLNEFQQNFTRKNSKYRQYKFSDMDEIGSCFLVHFLSIVECLVYKDKRQNSSPHRNRVQRIQRKLWDPYIFNLLIHMKFFNGMMNNVPKIDHEIYEKITPIYRGKLNYSQLTEEMINVLDRETEETPIQNRVTLADINDLVTEASGNACNHAYKNYKPNLTR